jgi:hypothetical protein
VRTRVHGSSLKLGTAIMHLLVIVMPINTHIVLGKITNSEGFCKRGRLLTGDRFRLCYGHLLGEWQTYG